MDQHYEEKFFESVIKAEHAYSEYLKNCDISDTFNLGFYAGSVNGIRTAIRLFAIQTGKPMKDGESIKDYYRRWLSMEYSQTDIPDKTHTLVDRIEYCDKAIRASWAEVVK